MSDEELLQLLEPTGIPFTDDHWERPPTPPYGVYVDPVDVILFADNSPYFTCREMSLELYLYPRDRAVEGKLEAVLTAAEICWERYVEYLESDRLYKITYEIEV